MNPRRVAVEVSSTVRRMPLSAARTRKLVELTMSAEKIRDAMISIAFVGKSSIASLNKNYLKQDVVILVQKLLIDFLGFGKNLKV